LRPAAEKRAEAPPPIEGDVGAVGAMGAALAHDSAEKHVQGAATYIDDVPEPAGTLHVAPGYAAASRGKIARLDLDSVRASPGVVAVLTAADIPGVNDCSPAKGDDPILAAGRIDFHGQVVFAVVAETRDQARRAARRAAIEIEAEPPAVTIEDAVAADMDILPPYRFVRGDAAAAIAASPRRLADSVRIGGQEHFYLEGQVALALPLEGGEMHVHSSTQHPTEIQHCIAKMLALPDAAVVCECRRMGGAFGGKESQAAQWAALAALAARVTGRPAKLRLDRDDDMIMTGKRHDFRADLRAGFDPDGRLRAVDMDLLSRCGVSADLSLGVNDRAMFHADNAYFYPALRIHSRRLKTNTVSNTAFRGFGGPQGMMAAERTMDAIAITLGLDPLDVRRRNFYGEGRDLAPYGQRVEDNVVPELVSELERSSDYRRRRQEVRLFNAKSRFLKKGLALTPVKFGISFTLTHLNQAGALVHVYTDGSVQVNHGGTEMGQGLYMKVAQVAADVFGLNIDRVTITATTTAKVPNTSPTAASAGSDLNGMAVKNAAETIRGRLVEFAAGAFAVPRDQVRFAGGQVLIGNEALPFAELAKRAHLARVSLSSTGFYATPKISWDREKVQGRPFFYYAYGAGCAEVTIDTTTGEMRVDRVDILQDVGRSLNPAIDIGQIEGGFVQGMGWLTTEELVYDAQGRLRTHAPSTYKIPTASDVPADFRVALFRSPGNREETVFRSKAVGEPPLMLAISVFSAITDAIASLRPGTIPPLDAPATPESIMRAVKAMTGA
jgi:xanthine dehydrogenase large subunit